MKRTARKITGLAAAGAIKIGLALAFVLLAGLCWLIPARAQEHAPPPPPPAVPGHAVESEKPLQSAPVDRGIHQGVEEPGPGGKHAPITGGEHELGHEPGEDGHGGHAAEGEHHEKEAMGIHLPSWIYGPLTRFWYSGPATVSAAGASVPAEQLEGKVVEFTYVDHHSHIDPLPTYHLRARVVDVGTQERGPTTEVLEITANGTEAVLYNPTVTFAYQAMFPEHLVISLIMALTLGLVGILLTRNLQRVPGRVQMALEMIYEAMDDFIHGLIGPQYKRYVPLVGTAFFYILFMNWAGLIPGWASATANINITAGMAVVVVVYSWIEGIRVNGVKGFLMHFVGEPWWLGPLNFPLHVIGELAKILSLTIRLFGNIFGEDVVLVIMIGLSVLFAKGLPLQTPMYFLVLFTSFVQALVFSILTSIYLGLMTSHGHAEHGEHGHGEHGHAHEPPAAAHAHA